ncbi:hypothetical protein OAA09_01090 [bacterium]|nr:hypothetical protein [bacterium]
MMLWAFLFACNSGNDTADVMPLEIVSCTHPDSRFEGVVQIRVEDVESWDSVHFEIKQNDRLWDTNLQTSNNFIWETRMQLYELDCYSDFEYETHYFMDGQ